MITLYFFWKKIKKMSLLHIKTVNKPKTLLIETNNVFGINSLVKYEIIYLA